MKKEILKKTFSANLQNVWIFAFFVNLYGILVVSGQKREIWYTRYIPLAPPPPLPPNTGPEYWQVIFHSGPNSIF